MEDYKGKYPIKTREKGEFLTLNQLTKKGMTPKEGCQGVEMYTNETHQRTAIYYRLEDAEPSEAAKERQKEQRQKRAAKRRELLKWYEDNADKWKTSYQWIQCGRVPKDSAEWRRGGEKGDLRGIGASDYYYCHERDTYQPSAEDLKRIKDEQDERYNNAPFTYNGKMIQN